MAKFIKVHREGEELLFNIEKIVCLTRTGNGECGFMFDDGDVFFTDETYETVRQIIGNAQGGFPMEPGRMY